MKTFTLEFIRAYEEEYVLGTLDTQGDFWIKKPKEELINHVRDIFDESTRDTVPRRCRLPDWDEIDDIVHAYGPAFFEGLNILVKDEDGNNVLECRFDKDGSEGGVGEVMIDEHHVSDLVPNDKTFLFFGHATGKCDFSYESFNDYEFDPSKLVLHITNVFDDLRIVTGVQYDSRELYPIDSGGREVSFECDVLLLSNLVSDRKSNEYVLSLGLR